MKYIKTLAAATVSSFVAHAAAVSPNQFVSGEPLFNPYTGEEVDTWRLVGRGTNNCSAVQVSREWVMASAHCALSDGIVFRNGYSNDSRGSAFDCDEGPTGSGHIYKDFSLCRLLNPERFDAPIEYPPIAIVDDGFLSLDRAVGVELVAGFSGQYTVKAAVGHSPARLNTSFGAAPNSALNSFLLPQGQLISHEPGDSGGAHYWFAPGGHEPLLWQVIGNDAFIPWEWVREKIAARGDVLPRFLTHEQHFGRPLRTVPPAMNVSPTARVSSGRVSVSWVQPPLGTGQQIDDYVIYEGVSGRWPRRVILSQGARAAELSGITNIANRRVCVVPRNDGLESFAESNCTNYSAVLPEALGLAFASGGAGSIKSVNVEWTLVGATKSDVSYSIRNPFGGVRTVSMGTVDQTSLTLSVQVGAELCVAVTPKSNWAAGAVVKGCFTPR